MHLCSGQRGHLGGGKDRDTAGADRADLGGAEGLVVEVRRFR